MAAEKLMFRSTLLCNGLRPDHLRKAAASGADAANLELEDGVPLDRKPEARANVAEALKTLDWGLTSTFVRVENPAHGLLELDLDALVPARPTGILIAKTAGPQDVVTVSEALAEAEARHGVPVGTTRIGAMIEAAEGFFNVEAIAKASPRMAYLSCGEGDLETALGYRHLRHSSEPKAPYQPYLLYLRSRIVFAAHAAGISVVSPGSRGFVGADSDEALYLHYRFLYQLGFDGASSLTPKMVPLANRAFSPNEEEIAFARHVMKEMERAAESGLTVVPQPDGSFVGEVHLGPAQRVLDDVAAAERRLAHADRAPVS
jgi:citrate lyase subunit beta/citryl-CoA lyase